MELSIATLAIGNKYWWMPHNKGPITLTVVGLEGFEIKFSAKQYYWCHGDEEILPIVWTLDEWDDAKKHRKINDWLSRMTVEDLADGERLCSVCSGHRWEDTQDSEVLPCMWCGMAGKRKRGS